MAIEGVTWGNWNAPSPPTSNVCAAQKTVTTNTQNTTVKIRSHLDVCNGRMETKE